MPDDITIATETRADPGIMRGVIPHLSMGGQAGAAADFYTRAFGARELARMPVEDEPEKLLHVHLEINGGSVNMTDCTAPWETVAPKPAGLNLLIVVKDGDAWWERAVAAGCSVKMPFQRMFWGDRWGLLEDPFGVEWAIDEPAEWAGAATV